MTKASKPLWACICLQQINKICMIAFVSGWKRMRAACYFSDAPGIIVKKFLFLQNFIQKVRQH